jgi:hypothetical protein
MGRDGRAHLALRLGGREPLCAFAQHGLITVSLELKAISIGVKKKRIGYSFVQFTITFAASGGFVFSSTFVALHSTNRCIGMGIPKAASRFSRL